MTDQKHASTLGQFSWALFEWARNPYYILIVIYIFGPYFSAEVIGDPVRGQEIWGYINGFAGLVTACLAPFLGAVADKVGRRKPWIGCFIAMMVPAILLLWLAVPGQAGWGIVTLAVALAVAGTGFAFTEVFHNAMLPSVVPYPRLGRVSGWGLALGNGGALIILVFMLYCFALPASGLLDWGWLPDQVMFGLDTEMFEHDRIAAPITAVWLVLFALPLFFFTPDQSNTGVTAKQAIQAGTRDVSRTVLRLKQYRNIATYLLARMFFNDGKVAIMTFYMIYATGIFDWGGAERLLVGVFLTVFAIAAGFIGGWLDDIFGSKKSDRIHHRRQFRSLAGRRVDHAHDDLLHRIRGLERARLGLRVFPDTARDRLPRRVRAVRLVHHLRLRQQPHHAGAHRAGERDDQVLRSVRALRAGDDVHRADHGGVLHRLFRQPADRLRIRANPACHRRRADAVRQGGTGRAIAEERAA